jgi:hypothetical protein
MEFTSLERAVLDEICDQRLEDGAALRSTFATAVVTHRDNTGHGFYTYFDLGEFGSSVIDRLIDGPIAYMKDMGPGMTMGFIIWPKTATPACLEGYQNCDDYGETVNLKLRDLASLRFDRFEWF